jgi:tRNA nucleotidyltransferase (CCA-adding enzyme)
MSPPLPHPSPTRIQRPLHLPLPADLLHLLQSEPDLAHTYVVGGSVRDALLQLPVRDLDLEVFGIDASTLERTLRRHGPTHLVGRSFGVVKLTLGDATHDFSLPRTDSKVRPGHRGFIAHCQPDLSLAEAASRRDFTINALFYDPRTHVVLDAFGGLQDLEQRVLRPTSPAFVEDPLRVLRGMQFAARFDLTPAPETLDLAQSMHSTFPELAAERVREEWMKWATQSRRPSAALHFLKATHWISHFPELAALVEVAQDPEWHPEGDVFTHTAHALDALVQLPDWLHADPETRAVLSFAVLGHDFGKATCTQIAERRGRPRIISPGHEKESTQLVETFLTRLGLPLHLIQRVRPLVAQHMAYREDPSDRSVRRLAQRLVPESIENLAVVMTADARGRPPRPAVTPPGILALLETAARLQVQQNAPHPLLLGRHLLALGLPPGPAVGRWVHAAYEAQIDGAFPDLPGALDWVQHHPDFPVTR